jgi:hypothetical protein
MRQMRTLITRIPAFLLLLLLTQAASGQDQQKSDHVMYTGTVQDEHHSPLAGIKVVVQYKKGNSQLLSLPTNYGATDTKGSFRIPIPRSLYNDITEFYLSITGYELINLNQGAHEALKENPYAAEPGWLIEKRIICRKVVQEIDVYKKRVVTLEKEMRARELEVDSLKRLIPRAFDEEKKQLVGKVAQLELDLKKSGDLYVALRDTIRINVRQMIFTKLDKYTDDLKNLDQVIRQPQYIKDLFVYPEYRNEFLRLVRAYESSRAEFVEQKKYSIATIESYWGHRQKYELEDVYNLEDFINRKIIVEEFNEKILKAIDAYGKQTRPRIALQPKAVKAAEKIAERLVDQIAHFETETDELGRALEI